MNPEARLEKLGIELSGVPSPLGSYVPCVRSGDLLFLSGMLPMKDGKLLCSGRVGEAVSAEEARQGARQAVINALAVLKSELGELVRVNRCLKVNGYVASAPDFTEQPKVINGASDLLFEVFGDKGRHARAAVGVYVLPLDASVEIDFIFEIVR